MKGKPLIRHYRIIQISLMLIGATVIPHALAGKPGSEELALEAIAQSHLNLYLCANYAYQYQQDHSLGDKYRLKADRLYDETMAAGWTSKEFADATLSAQERIAELEFREDDTRETFKGRHFAGAPCEERMEEADHYIAESAS